MSSPLPVEIWRQILRLAVYIPGLLETKWDYSPDTKLWRGWPEPLWSSSSATRQTLVQVSRDWRDIGVELLYESIGIPEDKLRRHISISKLLAIFEASTERYPNGYGWWTKRIDIPILALSPSKIPSLIRLLELCHNIQVLTIVPYRSLSETIDPKPLFDILRTRFSHSLKRLAFNFDGYEHNPTLPPMWHLPLDTLLIRGNEISAPNGDPDTPIFTHVSTLTLDLYSYQDFPAYQFPALLHLSLNIKRGDVPDILPFMTTIGTTLLSLHLVVDYTDALSDLLQRTPKLQSLVFDDIDFASLHLDTSYPNIIRIGLKRTRPWYHIQLKQGLKHIISHKVFPKLRCIRMLDESSPLPLVPIELQYRTSWPEVVAICSDYGIRLEDKECELIQLPLPSE